MRVLRPARPVYIHSCGSVVGKKEHRGPLGPLFDRYDETDFFGCDTFEKAESTMQREAVGLVLKKSGITPENVTCLFAGDLVNQCIASTYGLFGYGMPYLGIFGACSTAAEGLLLSSLIAGCYGERCVSVTSSHYCTAERQFRFPLEYGSQRPPTAQWTVTGAAAFLCTADREDVRRLRDPWVPRITAVMPGKVVDGGINDANNMGAAMAPAALDTLLSYVSPERPLSEIDMVLTGDLGREGSEILCDLAWTKGLDMRGKHADCGKMIYHKDTEDGREDTHSGGSGCGCSGVVLAADILEAMRQGQLKRILFIGTGALMNSMALYQGQTIPGVAHLIEITAEITGGEN